MKNVIFKERMKRESSNPEKLGLILKRNLKSLGLERKVKGHKIISFWKEVVGEKIASQAEPFKLEGSKLYIKVESASWRTELFFMKDKIIKQINQYSNDNLVKDIIFLNR